MRSLTASDRSVLIRLASSKPKGSPERKAILAGLRASGSDAEVASTIEALANFTRSVGQSDEERDLLATRLGVKTRGWRARLKRNQLTDRDRAAIAQAVRDTAKWG
jgi:hypothetical protein